MGYCQKNGNRSFLFNNGYIDRFLIFRRSPAGRFKPKCLRETSGKILKSGAELQSKRYLEQKSALLQLDP